MDKLEVIKKPIEKELSEFKALFDASLKSSTPLLDEVLGYIKQRNGKMMRPILVLLMAKLYGGINDSTLHAALSLEKLEAMTCVCSVGLDMIAIPGDTPVETIAGIIADEMAIGVINNKTTAVRVIPAIGKQVGDELEFGGLLGAGPVMKVNTGSPAKFINRGGKIPAPLHSLKN